MKRRLLVLPIVALAASGLSGIVANAHECKDDTAEQQCEDSSVAPNWRDGNYVPLFDLEDREDPEQRKKGQRWREECEEGSPGDEDYESRQMCYWGYGGISGFPDRDDPDSYRPNEWHTGFAANHCFLFEFAHQCEDHGEDRGEGVHDKHGGAIYADICVSENPESEYCDDGMQDTQVGLTIMDHNPCGVIVPIVACIDEYHVIRPFDTEYTNEQMEDSQEYIPRILEDPELYLCGYEQHREGNPVCPAEGEGDGEGAVILPLQHGTAATTGGKLAGEASASSLVRAGSSDGASVRALDAMSARATGGVAGSRSEPGSPAVLALVMLALVVRARGLVRAR